MRRRPHSNRSRPGSHADAKVIESDQEASRRGFLLTISLLLSSLAVSCMAQWGGLLHGQLGVYGILWPQAWSFFTGLSNKDVPVAYSVGVAGVLGSPEDQRAAWSDRGWGLSQSGDSQSLEISQVASQIPDRYWQPCAAGVPAQCHLPPTSAGYFSMKNQSSTRDLCGVTAIFAERPASVTPGALPGHPWTVYRVTVVNLLCTG
jgi:Sporulation delaying protein SdpA